MWEQMMTRTDFSFQHILILIPTVYSGVLPPSAGRAQHLELSSSCFGSARHWVGPCRRPSSLTMSIDHAKSNPALQSSFSYAVLGWHDVFLTLFPGLSPQCLFFTSLLITVAEGTKREFSCGHQIASSKFLSHS